MSIPIATSTSKSSQPIRKRKGQTTSKVPEIFYEEEHKDADNELHDYTNHSKRLRHIVKEQADFIHDFYKNRKDYDVNEVFEPHEDGITVKGSTFITPSAAVLAENFMPSEHLEINRVDVPIHIGKFPLIAGPPDNWATLLNDRMEKAGFDYLPKFPFVIGNFGGIGNGKSNAYAYLLTTIITYARPQNVTIVADMGDQDPTLNSVISFKPPEGVNVNLTTELPLQQIDEDIIKVARQFKPKFETIRRGQFTPQEVTSLESRMLGYSSIHHPYTNQDGTILSHEPRFDPLLIDIDLDKFTRDHQLCLSKSTRQPFSSGRAHLKWLEDEDPAEDIAEIVAEPNVKAPPFPPNWAAYIAWRNMNPAKNAFNIATRDLLQKASGDVCLKNKQYEMRMVVVDDAARFFSAGSYPFWKRFITTLRHAHHSIAFGIQKITLLPTVVRQQMTHAFLWPVKMGAEYKRIVEEFSGRIHDFERIWAYCMMPTAEFPKPFMYVNFSNAQEPVVMKCFTEIIKSTIPKEDIGLPGAKTAENDVDPNVSKSKSKNNRTGNKPRLK
jgi:hypothetical protein